MMNYNNQADKGFLLLLFVTFSLTCCCQASRTYIQLKQGVTLNFSDQLVSRNGDFALGFSGNYLVINSTYSDDHPVWSANRDKPIEANSGVLTLDDVGNLKIIHSGGQIKLYSGKSASTGNLTAELEDSGNFVLKEDSGNRVWESFDNPTDTLLPGMKLGFNYKRNKTWSLKSWAGEENPKQGEFIMEWDYKNGQIVVKRKGGIFWRSRKLNSENPLANMLLPSPLNNFMFNIVSNDGEEESVNFQVYFDKLSPVQLRIFSRWFLNYNGDIFLAGRGWPDILTTSMSCDQNKTESECVNRELSKSKCRNDGSRIELRTGNFHWLTSVQTMTNVDNKNLSFTDCRDFCWNNCSCTGFQKRDQTICVLYEGPFEVMDLQSDGFDDPSNFGYRGRNGNQFYAIIPGGPPPGSPP